MRKLDDRLKSLIGAYGYEVNGSWLMTMDLPFMPPRKLRKVRSLFDAAEVLIPIISEDGFYEEFKRITKNDF